MNGDGIMEHEEYLTLGRKMYKAMIGDDPVDAARCASARPRSIRLLLYSFSPFDTHRTPRGHQRRRGRLGSGLKRQPRDGEGRLYGRRTLLPHPAAPSTTPRRVALTADEARCPHSPFLLLLLSLTIVPLRHATAPTVSVSDGEDVCAVPRFLSLATCGRRASRQKTTRSSSWGCSASYRTGCGTARDHRFQIGPQHSPRGLVMP